MANNPEYNHIDRPGMRSFFFFGKIVRHDRKRLVD